MSFYCYKCPQCGTELDVEFPIGKAAETYPCPKCGIGVGMRRHFTAEAVMVGIRRQAKPSLAAGVDPDQVPEAMAFDRSVGLHVDYTPTGLPKFESLKQKTSYFKAHGLIRENRPKRKAFARGGK